MEPKIRQTILTPLINERLNVIIPRLNLVCEEEEFTVPAKLVSKEDAFVFELHLCQQRLPKEFKPQGRNGFYTRADCLSIKGEINGEIPFSCEDIFPPRHIETRSRGTSVVTLTSECLRLTPEGTDCMASASLSKLLGGNDTEWPSYSAHLIYHGPKLLTPNAGTHIETKNDFIGSSSNASFDTHQFEGKGYKAALIERDEELHLHVLGENLSTPRKSDEEIGSIVDSIQSSVGLCFGFNPWPVYREVRIDHAIKESWVMPHLRLPTTYLAPVSEALWHQMRATPNAPIHDIIPCIADGLRELPNDKRKRLLTLLWHVRSIASSENSQMRLLSICAALDGFMKLVIDAEPSQKLSTRDTWEKASQKLGISWDKWTHSIFELWGKYRHHLSHGWLWINQDSKSGDSFSDYAILGCALHLLSAHLCGYSGPVVSNFIENRMTAISDIKI